MRSSAAASSQSVTMVPTDEPPPGALGQQSEPAGPRDE